MLLLVKSVVVWEYKELSAIQTPIKVTVPFCTDIRSQKAFTDNSGDENNDDNGDDDHNDYIKKNFLFQVLTQQQQNSN